MLQFSQLSIPRVILFQNDDDDLGRCCTGAPLAERGSAAESSSSSRVNTERISARGRRGCWDRDVSVNLLTYGTGY